MNCFYCNKSTAKKSNEHVISDTVMRYVFGDTNRNITKSELFGDKTLFDHEQTIGDICSECNSLLSTIDCAGLDFVKDLNSYNDLTGVSLKYNSNAHLWLLKTHLNFIRMIKEKHTNRVAIINKGLPENIIVYQLPPSELYLLLICGIKGKDYYWDENDLKHIQYFSYRSVSFPKDQVLCSNFRIKAFDTFLLIPNNNNYKDFSDRCISVLEEMKNGFNFDLQLIVTEDAIKNEIIYINKTEDVSNI